MPQVSDENISTFSSVLNAETFLPAILASERNIKYDLSSVDFSTAPEIRDNRAYFEPDVKII